MTQERFEWLLGRHVAGLLTQEEWEELKIAIRDGEHEDRLLGDISAKLEEGGVHPVWNGELEGEIWKTIEGGMKKPVVKKGRVVPMVVRWSAVAAGILACVAMVWVWRSKVEEKPEVKVARVVQDVRPGGNKAVLTLANGQQIILDSSGNGQIAQQGATKVIKLNGLISYKGAAKAGEILYNTISTPRGGQYELLLPDGSRVWLNSASSLRFPTAFTGSRREVELHGEGYFEIAKDASKPFTVGVNDMKVRVLGTSFNTMAYPDEGSVNTTLVDGAVVVEDGAVKRQLGPGQQAAVDEGGRRVQVRKADIRQVTAWRSGLFEFDHTELTAVMRQLARWYDIEVEYRVKTDKTPLGGSISRNLNLKEVLALLQENGINHFSIEGKKVIVLP